MWSMCLMHREILCKVLGILLVMGACSGFGLNYCKLKKREITCMQEVYQGLHLLKGEMEYQYASLPESFARCGEHMQGACGGWFLSLSERLDAREGLDFTLIWQQELERYASETRLIPGAKDILITLGKQLSFSDRDTQLGALSLALRNLQLRVEEAGKVLPGKLKLGTTLCLLTGALTIILLM